MAAKQKELEEKEEQDFGLRQQIIKTQMELENKQKPGVPQDNTKISALTKQLAELENKHESLQDDIQDKSKAMSTLNKKLAQSQAFLDNKQKLLEDSLKVNDQWKEELARLTSENQLKDELLTQKEAELAKLKLDFQTA